MKNADTIIKFIAGCIGSGRKNEIFSEIEQDPESEKVYNKVKAAWAFLASTNKMSEYKIENSYKKLQTKINLKSSHFRFKAYPLFKYAAIFLLILGTLPLMLYMKNQLTNRDRPRYTSVVARYKEMSQVVLPDSSIVWLNSGTTITYNSDYSLNNRDLFLKGEAYLSVRRNIKIPFTITCNELKIRVLGTKFNVSAYPEDHKITVVLKKGAIELLHNKDKSFNYKLKPGEMAQYDEISHDIKINKTNVMDYTAWKDGLLLFRDTPMKEVIKTLERKFNVEFVVDDPIVYEPVFNATFKNESLVEILNYIRYSCHIRNKIHKDTKKMKVELY